MEVQNGSAGKTQIDCVSRVIVMVVSTTEAVWKYSHRLMEIRYRRSVALPPHSHVFVHFAVQQTISLINLLHLCWYALWFYTVLYTEVYAFGFHWFVTKLHEFFSLSWGWRWFKCRGQTDGLNHLQWPQGEVFFFILNLVMSPPSPTPPSFS